jgi:hypothetical protein
VNLELLHENGVETVDTRMAPPDLDLQELNVELTMEIDVMLYA